MDTTTSVFVMLGILVAFASLLLLVVPEQTGLATVCPGPSQLMLIQSGTQLSAGCINPPELGNPANFLWKREGDARRFFIAQRIWSYGDPAIEQVHLRTFNNDVRQYAPDPYLE